jgi:hypothetical protein
MNSSGRSSAVGRVWKSVGLADAGLAGDQHGTVVTPEGEQMAARVQDGDADGDTRGLGRAPGGGDEDVGVLGGQRG